MNAYIKFTAKVVKGQSRGKKLGFPTLNMQIPEKLTLVEGIHACWVWIGKKRFMGALHYGPVPVFDQMTPSLEVHLLDENRNIKPKELTVEVVEFIRSINIFSSPELLIEQIQKDVDNTRNLLTKFTLSMIAVIGKNRELGKDNKLLWDIPEDLKRFKELTSGHPIIMGRVTYESIGKPLPARTNIVLSRNSKLPERRYAETIKQALEIGAQAPGSDEIFVIGGASIYEQFIGMADRLYLTLVDQDYPSADAFFPSYSAFGRIISKEPHLKASIPYTYLTLQR